MLQLGGMLSKLMQFKCVLDGSLGANPLVDQQFSKLLEKIIILTSFDHISNVFKAIGKNKGSEIKNLLQFLKMPSPFSPL